MDELLTRLLRGLRTAGRDWRRIDRCLWEWEVELDRLSGREAWAEEYREFLQCQYSECLLRLEQQAVEWEEYEWAAALLRKRNRILGTLPDGSV